MSLPQQAGQTLTHIIQLHPEPPEQTLLHGTLGAPGNLQMPNTLTRPRYHTFSSWLWADSSPPWLCSVFTSVHTEFTSGQVPKDLSNLPETTKSQKGNRSRQEIYFPFPNSECRLFKDRHVEFVKRTKKTKNEDSFVCPELRGTEGLREAHSVHACK